MQLRNHSARHRIDTKWYSPRTWGRLRDCVPAWLRPTTWVLNVAIVTAFAVALAAEAKTTS